MKSALEQPQVVSRYLQEECAMGWVIGPLAGDVFSETDLMISRFSVIPKGLTGPMAHDSGSFVPGRRQY